MRTWLTGSFKILRINALSLKVWTIWAIGRAGMLQELNWLK